MNSVCLQSSTEIQGDHVKCCVDLTRPDPTTEVSALCGSYMQHMDTQVPSVPKPQDSTTVTENIHGGERRGLYKYIGP